MRRGIFLFLLMGITVSINAQITSENGNLMGEFINYEQNLIPDEDSEGFVVPDSTQLEQWKRMMDLFVAESYSQAEDSLSANFSDYEMVLLTDTSFIDRQYYLIREKTPVTLGWGLYASDPNYQRDVIVGVPHPIYDSFTPQQGVNMFQYLGGRLLAMAGTHRCSNDEASFSDGTTTVCNDTDTSEKFKVSDMAHYDSTAFQIAHESLKELSSNVYAINLHGHASSSCEDVFLSNGREDDPQPGLQAVRDSLIADNVDAAMTGDGSSCTLIGSTNVQGRFINGSTTPATEAPDNNTGFFFHVEQSRDIRRSLAGHIPVIDAFGELISRSFNTVTFPDYPSLTINEIHFNPDAINGDANNNGSVGSVSDEFLEIINTADTTIALDKWIVADNTSDRHVIESGTNILPGQALLLFGRDTFDGDFGGATVQAASTETLSLNNTGDKISIKTPANDVITFVEYPGTESGVSITLNPDITSDTLVSHSTADTDDNSLFSPGTKINGDTFLPFVEIDGNSGWRMMASPTSNLPIQDLVAFSPIQGFGDDHDKNFYTNYNGSSWEAPSSLSDSIKNGEGFIFYFFDNTNAESSELPLKLRATGSVPSSDVTIDLHTSGDNWNLIGNPFDSAIDFSSITINGGSLASSVGQIYDPSISNYVTTTSRDDTVAAWQGLFIENSSASSITIPTSAQTDGGTFLKTRSKDLSYVVLTLRSTELDLADELVIVLSPTAKTDWDLLDAEELTSLSINYVSFFGIGEKEEEEIRQSQFSIPVSFEEQINIPLKIGQVGTNSDLILSVSKLANVPDELELTLHNQSTNEYIDLLEGSFEPIILKEGNATDSYQLLLSNSANTSTEADPEVPARFEVYQNYPNPFNPSTNISYSLPEPSPVLIEVFNTSGALIRSTAFDQQVRGKQSFSFDGSSLSSGMYIYRITSNFGSKSGKMILLK
ncbi:MAG: T9SS C-terminal target domain-containing protein [Balneola sp.]|nr:MAG: T9SS C-terminal target domain-containing protein [Balneola sp.]